MIHMRTLQELLQVIYTRSRLLDAGVSAYTIRRRLAEGSLFELRQGIYVEGKIARELTPWERADLCILAYSLRNPDALFSHQSAASLYRLPLIRPVSQVHVYGRGKSRGKVLGVQKHFPRERSSAHSLVLGRRVTDIETTLLDCASTLPKTDAVVLADAALHGQMISYETLQECFLAYRGRNSSIVHAVGREVSALSESPGESLVRLLLQRMGIEFEEQRWFETATRRYRVDFYLPQYDIVVEFDGAVKYQNFGSPDSVVMEERIRETELQNLGLLVYRVRWNEVFTHPELFASGLQECIERARRRRLGENRAPLV